MNVNLVILESDIPDLRLHHSEDLLNLLALSDSEQCVEIELRSCLGGTVAHIQDVMKILHKTLI